MTRATRDQIEPALNTIADRGIYIERVEKEEKIYLRMISWGVRKGLRKLASMMILILEDYR